MRFEEIAAGEDHVAVGATVSPFSCNLLGVIFIAVVNELVLLDKRLLTELAFV